MNIRPIQIQELDAVIDLHIEGLERELDLMSQILKFKSVDKKGVGSLKKILYQMIHVGECQILVAEENDQFWGYCLATKKFYPIEIPQVCGCINGIYIKDEFKRQGLGTKLYQLAVEWFKTQGVEYIELYHMINDDRAAAFWKKMGYVNVQLNCAVKI